MDTGYKPCVNIMLYGSLVLHIHVFLNFNFFKIKFQFVIF